MTSCNMVIVTAAIREHLAAYRLDRLGAFITPKLYTKQPDGCKRTLTNLMLAFPDFLVGYADIICTDDYKHC